MVSSFSGWNLPSRHVVSPLSVALSLARSRTIWSELNKAPEQSKYWRWWKPQSCVLFNNTSVVSTMTCESLRDFWKYRAKCSTINNEVLLEFSDLIWSTFMVEFAHRQKEWIFEKKKLVVEVLLFCPKKKAFLKKRRASFFQKKGLLFDFETPHLLEKQGNKPNFGQKNKEINCSNRS